MPSDKFHRSIKWFVIIVLILSLFPATEFFNFAGLFNFGVTIALIYIILRAPLRYSK